MSYVKITNFAIKDSTNDIIRGTEHDDEYNAIEASFTAQPSATQTLTNKTIALGSNTVSGTTAQFNTALSDGDFATLAGTETLTNKALNGTLGATTPSTVVATTITGTDLTTTGNTILGNASTDTLNVGNGDLIKDASGNVGIGVTPSAWSAIYKALQVGATASVWSGASGELASLMSNAYFNGTNYIRLIAGSSTSYSQTSGAHNWTTASSSTAGSTITWTQAMTLDASGGLKTLNTIGVGNATPSTSGAGITFPATQSASTDANTLDDYEEGTWTPTIVGLTTAGTGTYTIQSGSYTKVGRLVTITCTVIWTAHTGTGSMAISGIPFAVGNIIANAEYTAVPEFLNMTMPASTTPMVVLINSGTQIFVYSQAVGSGTLTSLTMDAAANIYVSMTYQTA